MQYACGTWWLELDYAKDRRLRWAVVNTVMNFRLPLQACNVSADKSTVRFTAKNVAELTFE